MKLVNIAKFKAKLGTYLDFVRKGEEVVVLDRKSPLAVLIPFRENKKYELVIEEALDNPLNLFKLKSQPSSNPYGSLKFLKEERRDL